MLILYMKLGHLKKRKKQVKKFPLDILVPNGIGGCYSDIHQLVAKWLFVLLCFKF